MRAALMAHDEVLRSSIEAHDGFLFSHTGDGVAAAFASPRSAVDAAITAQRALHCQLQGMGLATGGDGELREGDYFGTVLNRRAWRSFGGRVDGGSAQRSRSVRSWAATAAGCAEPDHGVSAAGAGRSKPTFRRCGRSMPSPGNLELQPAPDGRESEVAEVARKKTDRDPARKWAHLTELARQRDVEAAEHAAVTCTSVKATGAQRP